MSCLILTKNTFFFSMKYLIYLSNCRADFFLNESSALTSLSVYIHTGWPVKHDRVVLVPCQTWLVQCRLLYCSGNYIFYLRGTRTAMLNRSSCILSFPVCIVPDPPSCVGRQPANHLFRAVLRIQTILPHFGSGSCLSNIMSKILCFLCNF